MTPAIPDPARCSPILASLNIEETREFYVTQLGFRVDYQHDLQYLIVKRDEMELHFWSTDNKQFPENSGCYIRGGQIKALYDEFKARGVPNLSEFAVRPWNMREFYIIDPHGNLLKFGCIPGES